MTKKLCLVHYVGSVNSPISGAALIRTYVLITKIHQTLSCSIIHLVVFFNFHQQENTPFIFIFIYILYINNLEKMEIDLQQNE